MKKGLKTEAILVLLLIVPFIYLALYWNSFPGRVPIHFNEEGVPDGFAGKTVGLLLLPGINILTYLLLKFLPRIDPRKKNYALFEGQYNAIRLAIHLFLLFVFFITTLPARTGNLLDPKLMIIGIAFFIMLMGNYMTAVRPNFFVGIRTPWTLSNEEVWKKTHRFAGRIWVAAAFLLLLYAIIFEESGPAVLFTFFALIVIPPVIYSYIVYQKITKPNGLQH